MIFEQAQIIQESTAQNVAQRVAKEFISFVNKELERKETLAIAFSGGSTPNLLFTELASIKNRSKIIWDKIHIFQVDERWVPRTHYDNNFQTLKHLLLDKIKIPEENIHPMPVTEDKEEVCKRNYEMELRLVLGNTNPSFDLILLGMGDDGHTASIFPGKSGQLPLHSENIIEIPFVEKLNSLRMTLTAKIVTNSKNNWILVTGKNKTDILNKVFTSNFDPELYPIHITSKSHGNIVFFIDEEAGLKISSIKKKENK